MDINYLYFIFIFICIYLLKAWVNFMLLIISYDRFLKWLIFLKAIKLSLQRWLLIFEELDCFEAIICQEPTFQMN